jgi:hypothetical protein
LPDAFNESIGSGSGSGSVRKHLREVEKEFLNQPLQTEFASCFVNLLVWLLWLERSFASRVFICRFGSGNAFGLPLWLCAGELRTHHVEVVPAWIIDGCLQGLFIKAVKFQESSSTPPVCPLRPPSTGHWNSNLQKSLPSSWVDSLTACFTKAAKSNNAGTPIHMWDKHGTSVLPGAVRILTFLWSTLTFLVQRNLHRKFRECTMASTHGHARCW